MNSRKEVSEAVIRRLPKYLRCLGELKNKKVLRISSKELSERMSLTASQIRQDLSCFGEFGQQGYGYNIEYLNESISKILGTYDGFKVIVIGAGNMGTAITKSDRIKNRGFDVVGVFDINEDLIGTTINDIEIQHIDKAEQFIKNNKIDIAVLTIPKEQTEKIAKQMVEYGIKGLWNFSAIELKLPKHIAIENVHLSDSIMVLGYKINNE